MKLKFRHSIWIALLVFSSSIYAGDTNKEFVKEIDSSLSSDNGFSESVDIFSGSVNISHTDLSLPGNGGLDISITRRYTTPAYIKGSLGYDYAAIGKMGFGWDINFGYIKINNATKVVTNTSKPSIAQCSFESSYVDHESTDSYKTHSLVMPDGNRDYLANSLSTDYSFITKGGWRGGCGTTGFIMYSPDGEKYVYGIKKEVYDQVKSSPYKYEAWFLSRIEDKNGNWTNISYRSDDVGLISNISTSDSRNVTFGYSTIGGFPTLSSLQANGETITYSYDSNRRLIKVLNGSRTLFNYSYTTLDTYTTLLKTVTTEANGIITYNYEKGTNVGTWGEYAQIKSRTTSGNLPAKTTYYVVVGSQGGWNETKQIKVYDDQQCTSYVYYTYLGTYGFPDNNWIWRDGKLKSKSQHQDVSCQTNLLEKTTYTYTRHQITNQSIRMGHRWEDRSAIYNRFDLALLDTQKIYRDGNIYSTSYSDFTSSGKPRTIIEESTNQSTNEVLTSRTTINTYTESGYDKGLEFILTSDIYDGDNNLASNQTNIYNVDFELTSEKANGILINYTYDSAGNLATAKNARNYQTTFSNYYRGQPRTISDSIGTKTKVIDYFGNVTSETNELGNTVSYEYEDINRLTKVTPPEGDAVTYVYGSQSYTVTVGDYQTVHTLDGFNRPVLVTEKDTANNTVRYQNIKYDAYGQTIFTSILSDNSTETVGTQNDYDALGRVTKLTTPDGEVDYEYLENSQIKYTNLRNFSSYYTFQGFGQPDYKNIIKMEHPSSSGNIITQINKNVVGRVQSVTQMDEDGLVNQQMTYTYHATYFDLPINEVYPQFTNHYTYDAAGNVASKKVNSGSPTYFTYDARNRLTKTNYPGSMKDVSYTYDKVNQMKSAINGVGDWAYTYTANGQPDSRTLSTNNKTYTFDYDYNDQHNVSQIDYPGLSVDYAPNAFGQATKAGSFASAVTYHPQGAMKSFTYGNGLTYALGMHSNKMAIGSIIAKSGSTTVLSKTYDYDGNGNATSIIDNLHSEYSVSGFDYDGIDRLVSATSSAWGGQIDYAYDVLGNITTKTLPNKILSYSYSSDNLLTAIDTQGTGNAGWVLIDVGGVLAPIPFGVQASTQYFNHDDRGNITYNSRHSLTYNDADQLITAATGSVSQTYLYDAMGKRVQVKDSSGNITVEIYDELDRLLLTEEPSGIQTSKIYLGNKLIAQSKNGTKKYIHFDTLGSTIAVSDASKNLTLEHYFPFGQKVENAGGTDNDQWYTGKKFDEFMSLSYHGARYYDPAIGRFYSNDPLGFRGVHSFNRYTYGNNNPYKYVDLDGRDADLLENNRRHAQAVKMKEKELRRQGYVNFRHDARIKVNTGNGNSAIRVVDIIATKAGQDEKDGEYHEIKTRAAKSKGGSSILRKFNRISQAKEIINKVGRGAQAINQLRKDIALNELGGVIQRSGQEIESGTMFWTIYEYNDSNKMKKKGTTFPIIRGDGVAREFKNQFIE